MAGSFVCTAEALERLEAQLDAWAVSRLELLDRIGESSSDSLNPDENMAKEQLSRELERLDAQIDSVKAKVMSAKVVDAAGSSTVMVGSKVVLAFDGDPDDTEAFLVGELVEGAEDAVSVVSPLSPLGSVLLGSSVGDSVSWSTPAGATLAAELLEIA